MNEATGFCDGECPDESDDLFDKRLEEFEKFEDLRSFTKRCNNNFFFLFFIVLEDVEESKLLKEEKKDPRTFWYKSYPN